MLFSKKTKTSIIQKHVRISLKKQNVDGILQKRQKKKNLATENNNSKHAKNINLSLKSNFESILHFVNQLFVPNCCKK